MVAPTGTPAVSDIRCEVAAAIASTALGIPLSAIFSNQRGEASIAHARHVAMYLANVGFNAPISAVARGFGRERTSVTYAVARIEDERDDVRFDAVIAAMEEAVERIRLCMPHSAPSDPSRSQASRYEARL